MPPRLDTYALLILLSVLDLGLCAQNAVNPHQVVIPMTSTSVMTSLSTPLSTTSPTTLATSRPQSSTRATEVTTVLSDNATAVVMTTSPTTSLSRPTSPSTTLKPVTTTKRPRLPGFPYIDAVASKNITAMLGKTAYLTCRVHDLGNKTVSWVRHRDIHLLTVGVYTYTNDQRFRSMHQPRSEDWTLQLKYPQHRDEGIYECQVSTVPHTSHFIHLEVVEPTTEIVGAPDLFIDWGSTINLTCVIHITPEPPAFVFWDHNQTTINTESARRSVVTVTSGEDTTTASVLLIREARYEDSGRYKCNPSNANGTEVTVHVLHGEKPAAMQHGGQARHRHSYLGALVLFCASMSLLSGRTERCNRL